MQLEWLGPVFHPASPPAAAIEKLFLVVLAVCLGILLIVSVAVVSGLIRFRQKPGQGEPPPIHGNWKLEAAWTLIPILVVIWLLSLTARGMKPDGPGADQAPELEVVSHQWWWEARYPKTGVVVANEIHLPVGVRWLVALDSADVIHDFWVPRLAPKMDAVPGHPNRLWLEADEAGSYLGTCSEYCGAQHAQMHFLVIAQEPAEFEAWQRAQEKPPVPPASEGAREGQRLFQGMACISCHAVGGPASASPNAPDLTHFASRQTLGAVLLPNTPANLVRWLKDPQTVKPATLMPDLKLSDAQVSDLAAYLESLR